MNGATNHEKQVSDEVRWVNALATHLALELAAAPAKQPEPRPDVLLSLVDGRNVGVEVVEAMDEALRRGNAGTLKLLAKEVTDDLKARCLDATVSLSISHGALGELGRASRGERRALREQIVECVCEALSAPLTVGQRGWIYAPVKNPASSRDGGFHYLGGLRHRGLGQVSWLMVTKWHEPGVLTAVSGSIQTADLIQQAIDRKQRKVREYDQQGLHELWLLVVGGTGSGGSFSTDDARRKSFNSPFARTFFLEAWEGECVELASAVADLGGGRTLCRM